jgi:eukaryotic-like serine/threonine-protein kinase
MPSPTPASTNGTAASPARFVGHYRIVTERGAGTFGSVYFAEDSRTGQPVAIRLLPRAVTDGPTIAATIRRRARTVIEASQTHPALVSVLEYGHTDDGQVFAVMERAEGRRLSDVLADHQIRDATATLQMAIELGGPLETLHNQGLVHAAVRPDNFVVAAGGSVKLLDVELVALRDVPALQQVVLDNSPAAYLAPEQIEGQPASEKTDVYAFGVMLYRMLDGAAPFEASTREETLVKHLQETPRPLNGRGRVVPGSAETAIAEALDKIPERRPFMQKLLNQIATNRSASTRRWKLMTATAAGLVVAAAIGVPAISSLRAPRPAPQVAAPPAAAVTPVPVVVPVEMSQPPIASEPAPEPTAPAALALPERSPKAGAVSAKPPIPLPPPVRLPTDPRVPPVTPWRPVAAPPVARVPAPPAARADGQISRLEPSAATLTSTATVVAPPVAREPVASEPRVEQESPLASRLAPTSRSTLVPVLAESLREREESDARAVIDWLLNQRSGEQ